MQRVHLIVSYRRYVEDIILFSRMRLHFKNPDEQILSSDFVNRFIRGVEIENYFSPLGFRNFIVDSKSKLNEETFSSSYKRLITSHSSALASEFSDENFVSKAYESLFGSDEVEQHIKKRVSWINDFSPKSFSCSQIPTITVPTTIKHSGSARLLVLHTDMSSPKMSDKNIFDYISDQEYRTHFHIGRFAPLSLFRNANLSKREEHAGLNLNGNRFSNIISSDCQTITSYNQKSYGVEISNSLIRNDVTNENQDLSAISSLVAKDIMFLDKNLSSLSYAKGGSAFNKLSDPEVEFISARQYSEIIRLIDFLQAQNHDDILFIDSHDQINLYEKGDVGISLSLVIFSSALENSGYIVVPEAKDSEVNSLRRSLKLLHSEDEVEKISFAQLSQCVSDRAIRNMGSNFIGATDDNRNVSLLDKTKVLTSKATVQLPKVKTMRISGFIL